MMFHASRFSAAGPCANAIAQYGENRVASDGERVAIEPPHRRVAGRRAVVVAPGGGEAESKRSTSSVGLGGRSLVVQLREDAQCRARFAARPERG